MRRAGIASTFLALLLAGGCGSHRLVAPLDEDERHELESLRARLGDTLVGIESPSPHDRSSYLVAFRTAGFRVAEAALVAPGTPIVHVRMESVSSSVL